MYKILEPIMVRMPLYSHEEYKKIDLFADVDKFIQNFSNRPSFLKAIAISSPDFYTSVIENEKNVVYSDKYRDSMLKYISRATSRATPFGAFSLVSFGKLDRETSFVIHEEKRSTFLNLIDADLFWKIIRELEQNAQIYPYLKVRLNPNLHITTNRVKNPYISHLGQSNTKFFQANIRNTKQFEMIQKYARNPISVKDLVYSLYVYNNKKIEIAKIQKYVDSLIENEFLLSELRFFDVHEGLSKIISVCKKSCFDCEMIENLKRINKVFCRLNAQCDDKEWLNAYFNLYKLCNEQFSGKNITNTLLFAPQYEATLGKNVLASIYRLENFATKTALPDNETTAVLYWKKLFKEKYGPYVEINFLELFDDNSGFGDPYAPKNHISTNEVPNESYKKRYLKNLLERKIVLSLAKGDNKIVFSNVMNAGGDYYYEFMVESYIIAITNLTIMDSISVLTSIEEQYNNSWLRIIVALDALGFYKDKICNIPNFGKTIHRCRKYCYMKYRNYLKEMMCALQMLEAKFGDVLEKYPPFSKEWEEEKRTAISILASIK